MSLQTVAGCKSIPQERARLEATTTRRAIVLIRCGQDRPTPAIAKWPSKVCLGESFRLVQSLPCLVVKRDIAPGRAVLLSKQDVKALEHHTVSTGQSTAMTRETHVFQ